MVRSAEPSLTSQLCEEMEVICDDREHLVFKYARDRYDNVSSQRLTIGDYIIGYRRDGLLCPLVIIERKTWADLAASIKDGRTNNVENLREYRTKTGAKIAYLIEGAAPANPERAEVAGIPYRNLRAHLDHLLYTDAIIELHTLNARDSLRRLLEFAGHLERYKEEPASAVDGIQLATAKREATCDEISDKIWASFKGISIATARAFRTFKIKQLFTDELCADVLANMEINGRKFGQKRAETIHAAKFQEHVFYTLLCSVPSIGPKRARAITDKVDARALFLSWNSTRELIQDTSARAIEKYLI